MNNIKKWFIINKRLIIVRWAVRGLENLNKIDLWLLNKSAELDDYDQRNVSLKRISDRKLKIDRGNELIENYKEALTRLDEVEL